MTFRTWVAAFSFTLSAQTLSAQATPPEWMCPYGQKPCPFYQPSMVYLLAHPEQFEGKRVRIIGFLNLEFEGNAIYAHRDDFQHGIDRNGFWVGFQPTMEVPDDVNGSYVMIEGRFTAKSRGHLGMWSGTIDSISFVKRRPSRAEVNSMPSLTRPLTQVQQSGTSALLISVSAVNDSVVWVAGANRTFLRTTNGGATWIAGQVPVPDAPNLQFRDVHALDARTAWLLSIGNGRESRIFKTTDAGTTWTTQFVNTDSAAFYDCFDFWSPDSGIVVSDVVRGEMVVRTTSDGGKTWPRVSSAALPAGIEGEGSFASSGTCVVTRSGGRAWIGTTKGRVVYTSDYGRSWRVTRAPVTLSDSVGVTSLAFRDAHNGIAFGGYGGAANDTLIAVTRDGGATWVTRTRPPFRGGISGGAYAGGREIVVAGFTGAAWSPDEGESWVALDSANYWGIGFAPSGAGWIVGRGGRIVRVKE